MFVRFIHYMVNNIPGNEVAKGEEKIDWVPSFTFLYNSTEQVYVKDDFEFFHPHVYLVYRYSHQHPHPYNPKQEQTLFKDLHFGRLTMHTRRKNERKLLRDPTPK